MVKKYEEKRPWEVYENEEEKEQARLDNIAYNQQLETEDLPEYDIFDKAYKRVKKLIKRLKEKGLMSEEQAKQLSRSLPFGVDDEFPTEKKVQILKNYIKHLNSVENKLKQLEALVQERVGGANEQLVKVKQNPEEPEEEDTIVGKALTKIKKFFTGGKKTRKQRKSRKVKKTRKQNKSRKQRKSRKVKKCSCPKKCCSQKCSCPKKCCCR